MKRVLITGANSYIGTSFEKYIRENYQNEFVIDTLDMLNKNWVDTDFSIYDSIFHVAGIAHIKETKENASLYYEVNRDLAIKTAQKAKAEGVRQFIYLSTVSVYGLDTGVITRETNPNPVTHYGKSKLEAETAIRAMQDENFGVCIVRPPMVYGKNCKGNFQTVIKIVKKSPVFPRIKNKRSMIYVLNLAEFVRMCIDEFLTGTYFPQNKEFICTFDMAQIISGELNKKNYGSILLGALIKCLSPFSKTIRKAFGTLIYVDEDAFAYSYSIVSNSQSVKDSV